MDPSASRRRTLSFFEGWAAAGVAAVLAETATLPIDTSKIRLQLQNKAMVAAPLQTANVSASCSSLASPVFITPPHKPKYTGMLHTLRSIVSEEGALSLWRGAEFASSRAFLYSGLRMGLYEPIRNYLSGSHDASQSSFGHKVAASGISGSFASAVFSPIDVLKIRLQAGSAAKVGMSKAFLSLYRENGVKGMYKGIAPNSIRSGVVAVAELSSYDQVKQVFLKQGYMQDGVGLHFTASFIAGGIATVLSHPIDIVKTNYMNQPIDATTGKGALYVGPVDCFKQLYRNGGVLRLYQGVVPSFLRLGPWAIIFFMSYEQLKRWRLEHL